MAKTNKTTAAAAVEAIAAVAAPAVKKARATRKAQPKAPKVETAAIAPAAPAAPAPAMNFVITSGARPENGGRLAAHTEAFFICAGFYDGKAIDKTVMRDIIGGTAVSYHTKQGNFEATVEGYKMTAQGINKFKARKPDPKDVAGYVAIMTTGQIDDRLVKNAGFVRAVKQA